MSRKHRKPEAEAVEPDLPITPMLDMSFQLMAFFVFTFRPMPSEGQIALALPKQEGGGPATVMPDSVLEEKPDHLVVTVTAAENGAIQTITLREPDGVGGEGLGASSEAYFKKLQERVKTWKGKPGKLSLELDPKLIHQYVVKLLDEAIRAGYTDIAPTPIKAAAPPPK